MNRREMVGSIAAAGVGTILASTALGQGAKGHDHHGHHGSHGKYGALIKATAHCALTAEVCIAHCADLLAAGKKEMGECNKKAHAMLAACRALISLASQNSSHTKDMASICAKICDECAEACKAHIKTHDVCRECYEACLECAKACRAI